VIGRRELQDHDSIGAARGAASALVVWFDEAERSQPSLAGGKGAAPAQLTAADLPVPPGFAITVEAYRIDCGPLQEQIAAVLESVERTNSGGSNDDGARLRALVEQIELPPTLQNAVAEAYAELGRRGFVGNPPDPRSSTRLSKPDRWWLRASPRARTRRTTVRRGGGGVARGVKPAGDRGDQVNYGAASASTPGAATEQLLRQDAFGLCGQCPVWSDASRS
jgi:hypothetical protein